jgi:hypothetical protein
VHEPKRSRDAGRAWVVSPVTVERSGRWRWRRCPSRTTSGARPGAPILCALRSRHGWRGVGESDPDSERRKPSAPATAIPAAMFTKRVIQNSLQRLQLTDVALAIPDTGQSYCRTTDLRSSHFVVQARIYLWKATNRLSKEYENGARQTHRTTEAAGPLALISWHHVDPPSSSSPLFHWTRPGQQGLRSWK